MIFNGGNPYVVYMDTGNGNKGMVEEYLGSAWTTVGSADFTAASAYAISPVFYNNNLYVSFADSTKNDLATVEEYTGGGWVTIGSAGFGVTCSYTSLAIDGSGNLYVGLTGINYSYLMEYTGTAWVTVGGGAFSTGTGSFVSVAIDASNNPYVAYGDGYYGGATVAEYVSGGWTYLGGYAGAGGSGGGTKVANYTSLVFNGGNPYVAYMDLSDNYLPNLVEWTGSWAGVGSEGFGTTTKAYYTKLAFNPINGNPYVSFADENVTDEAMVMEYSASSWVTVGSPHFSDGATSYNSLAFDAAGNPYVAYEDENIANGNRVTVMEYH